MEQGPDSNEIQKWRLTPDRPLYSENKDEINVGEGRYLNVAAGSNVGREREQQEDSYGFIRLEWNGYGEQLLVLCDGMGGREGGKIASRIATREIIKEYCRARDQWDRQSALELAVRHANRAIYDANDGKEIEARMGTTVAVVVIGDDGKWHSIHRGDTRIYNFSRIGPAQVGGDHSKVMDMVADGSLNAQDIFDHPENNKINKFLGNRSDEEFNFNRCGYRGQLRSGESLLLCSDGLWEMLRDNRGQIIAPFLKESGDVGDRIRNLISAANKAGGGDNISVGILEMKTENPVLSLINVLKNLVDRRTFSFMKARSWQELFDQIASKGKIVGSGEEYTPEKIMNQINRFRNGELSILNKITNGGHLKLREAVAKLSAQ